MRAPKYIALLLFLLVSPSSVVEETHAQKPTGVPQAIPKTWDEDAIAKLEVPLADPVGSPKHVSADYYYRVPVRRFRKAIPYMRPVTSRLATWIG